MTKQENIFHRFFFRPHLFTGEKQSVEKIKSHVDSIIFWNLRIFYRNFKKLTMFLTVINVFLLLLIKNCRTYLGLR